MGNVFFVAIGEIALVLILKEVGNVVIDFFLLSAVFETEFNFFLFLPRVLVVDFIVRRQTGFWDGGNFHFEVLGGII